MTKTLEIPIVELQLLSEEYPDETLEKALVTLIREKCSPGTSQESNVLAAPLGS